MTHIPAIDINKAINNRAANYNAVKIQINDPKTIIPEGCNHCQNDNNTYNGVNIEVNRPTVETCKHGHHNIYDYPLATNPITSEMVGFNTVNIPPLPVNYFINNKTLVTAEFELDNCKECKKEETKEVPTPNVTTIEEQKSEPKSALNFRGVSFKADNIQTKKEIEIVPPVELKPEVDINKVVSNLANPNYDIQAQQMEEIAKLSMEDPQKIIPYVVTEVFSELINIVKNDTTKLEAPSEKQIETRKKIIINEIVKEQAKLEKKDINEIGLPYEVSKEEIDSAMKLSPMEEAERNKEYALYTIAILAKTYTDEVEKETGNVIPLTDLPGVSGIVDTLRTSSNAGVKVAGIDSLRYIQRNEYKDELKSIYTLMTQDENPQVAKYATIALENV